MLQIETDAAPAMQVAVEPPTPMTETDSFVDTPTQDTQPDSVRQHQGESLAIEGEVDNAASVAAAGTDNSGAVTPSSQPAAPSPRAVAANKKDKVGTGTAGGTAVSRVKAAPGPDPAPPDRRDGDQPYFKKMFQDNDVVLREKGEKITWRASQVSDEMKLAFRAMRKIRAEKILSGCITDRKAVQPKELVDNTADMMDLTRRRRSTLIPGMKQESNSKLSPMSQMTMALMAGQDSEAEEEEGQMSRLVTPHAPTHAMTNAIQRAINRRRRRGLGFGEPNRTDYTHFKLQSDAHTLEQMIVDRSKVRKKRGLKPLPDMMYNIAETSELPDHMRQQMWESCYDDAGQPLLNRTVSTQTDEEESYILRQSREPGYWASVTDPVMMVYEDEYFRMQREEQRLQMVEERQRYTYMIGAGLITRATGVENDHSPTPPQHPRDGSRGAEEMFQFRRMSTIKSRDPRRVFVGDGTARGSVGTPDSLIATPRRSTLDPIAGGGLIEHSDSISSMKFEPLTLQQWKRDDGNQSDGDTTKANGDTSGGGFADIAPNVTVVKGNTSVASVSSLVARNLSRGLRLPQLVQSRGKVVLTTQGIQTARDRTGNITDDPETNVGEVDDGENDELKSYLFQRMHSQALSRTGSLARTGSLTAR
eukprot:GFYU01011581.1.p1 GENE.GFYU01011581.1~~GFYU01011581.1.p1  ORF type:complete len:646 (+),score=164.32 GFYU01011581.1:374-2311(+)